jgi:hypothetical protein
MPSTYLPQLEAPLPPASPLQCLPATPEPLIDAALEAERRGHPVKALSTSHAFSTDPFPTDSSDDDYSPPAGPRSAVTLRHSMDPFPTRYFSAEVPAHSVRQHTASLLAGRAHSLSAQRQAAPQAVDARIGAFGFAEEDEEEEEEEEEEDDDDLSWGGHLRSSSMMQHLRKLGRFGFGSSETSDPRRAPGR